MFLNLNGCFAWKNHTVGIYDAAAGTYRRPSPFAIKGVADIIAIYRGLTFLMEVKDKRGRQSDEQKLFEKSVKKHGGTYVLVRSLEEADEFLRQCRSR